VPVFHIVRLKYDVLGAGDFSKRSLLSIVRDSLRITHGKALGNRCLDRRCT